MTLSNEPFQSLIDQVERQQRLARRRALLLSLVPIVLAGLLLWFTATQIRKLAQVNTELQAAEKQLGQINAQLTQAQGQVALSQQELEAVQRLYEQTQAELSKTRQELETTRENLVSAQSQLEATKQELDKAQQQVEELQKRLDELNQDYQGLLDQYTQATAFKRYQVPLSETEIKSLELPDPQLVVLDFIYAMRFRDLFFNPRGFTLEEGFNSPNFAVFVLEQFNLLPDRYDKSKPPWDQLPQVDAPTNGDLIFYESGFTMFYYRLPQINREFVIGMTPAGVVALRADFAPRRGALKVDYSRFRYP